MKVLYVCSELFPLIKTGGLADVSAALPPALREAGCDVRLLLPAYPALLAALQRDGALAPLALPVGGALGPQLGSSADHAHGDQNTGKRQPALLFGMLQYSGMPTYLVDAPCLFERDGNPYLNAQGQAWPDNALRFAWLGWAAACLGLGLDGAWQPDIVHGHDWHTGLAPLYLRELAAHAPNSPNAPKAASLFTIHNLAYQGVFPSATFDQLGLPPERFGLEGVEFYGQVSYMKAALQFAQGITTVSPSYAKEILTPEQGMGLDGLLRSRAGQLTGILNGVDYQVWSPAHDTVLAQHYDLENLEIKAHAKTQLQQQLGLQVLPQALVFGVVSRLSEQKGLHLVQALIDEIVMQGGQLALLGGGDAELEQAFLLAASRHPNQVAVRIGYHEALGHTIMAGADVILVPSRFEPCGLTQLYGLRYGTLPLVHRVGGLADTVVDCSAEHLQSGTACGFVFDDFSIEGLQAALARAFALHKQPQVWARVQKQAMALRFDWAEAAQRYLSLYRKLNPAVQIA
jgi:starch synthase